MRKQDTLYGNYLKMSEEYTFEDIELTEDFARYIYDWYCENIIVNHPLSRADFVRANNQRVQVIFDDLKELNYLIEERKTDQIISHYGWMNEEAKELVPQNIVDHIEKLKAEYTLIKNNDDF
jgi:hypothetical protein